MSKRPDVRIPLFPADREARAVEALNMLFFAHADPSAPLEHDRVQRLVEAVAQLGDSVYDTNPNTADFAGPGSLTGADYTHPVKVAQLAMALCWRSGLPRSEVLAVGVAACLMNIGYIGTRSSFLEESHESGSDPPTIDVAAHPARSAALLADQHISGTTLEAIAQHHERWDGSGFPRSLRGTEIAPAARVLGLADTYISLRSPRQSRSPHRVEDALRLIAEQSDVLFEPALVGVLVDLVHAFPPMPERTATDMRMPPVRPAAERPRTHQDAVPPAAPRPAVPAAPSVQPAAPTAVRRVVRPAPARTPPVAPATPPRRRRRGLFSAREYLRERGSLR